MTFLVLACAAAGSPGLSEHAQSDAEIHASQQAQIDAMKTDVATIKARLIEAFPAEAAAAGVAPVPVVEDDAQTPPVAADAAPTAK